MACIPFPHDLHARNAIYSIYKNSFSLGCQAAQCLLYSQDSLMVLRRLSAPCLLSLLVQGGLVVPVSPLDLDSIGWISAPETVRDELRMGPIRQ